MSGQGLIRNALAETVKTLSGQRYTPEFKDEAVKLITERGYSVTDVA
jgi:transposase